ncbi:unnamed protein product [Symbiodinium sp. CCMP2456]|nr:unnamed protein product [Symbiodinium sp. CCMP2456]
MFKKMSESAIEQIGFAYLIHCLKRMLCSGYARQNDRFNAQDARDIQLDCNGRRGPSYAKKLNDEYAKLIQGILGDGGVKLLLHVDEHGKMEKNPFFRRGALVRAAGNERVAVIATFTEKPPALSVSNVNSESSECCGVPCTLPRPDMEKLTSEEFQGYPNKNPLLVPRDILESQDTEVKRYLASLRISLGIALEGDGSPPWSVALFGVVGVSLGNLHFQNEAAVFFKTLRHLLTETNRAARYRVPLSMSDFKVDDDQRGQRLHNLSLFMKERVVPRELDLRIPEPVSADKTEVTLQERLLDAIKFSRYHWDFEGRKGASERLLQFLNGIPVQTFYDGSSDATGRRKHHPKDAPGGILATQDIITLPVSSFFHHLPKTKRRLYEVQSKPTFARARSWSGPTSGRLPLGASMAPNFRV